MANNITEPTQKQRDYARKIAENTGISLPEEETSDAYSEFIDTNKLKPTLKQREFAARIADILNISLPEEETKTAYTEFVDTNREAYSQKKVELANAVNILDYARSQGLELKKDGRDYRVKNYSGGFIITPEKNQWNWFAENQGGGIVQLCMFLENKTYQEAVDTLVHDDMESIRRAPDWKPKPEPPKEFKLPEKNNTNRHVYAYLTKTRGIDEGIVKEMLDKGHIYENKHKSCVFVGRDHEGVPRHASVRSTNISGKAYKKDVYGSQKKYSFSISGTSGTLNVFEAPVDLLSYMSLQKLQGKPINDSYLALGGVSYIALERFLEDNKDIKVLRICTDGDEAGIKAASKINEKFGKDLKVIRQIPEHKDFNEDLMELRQVPAEDVKENPVITYEERMKEQNKIVDIKSDMRLEEMNRKDWERLLENDQWVQLEHSMELSTEYFKDSKIEKVELLYELEEMQGKEIESFLSEQINSPDKFYLGYVNGRMELIFRAPVFDSEEYYVSDQATKNYMWGDKSLKELAAEVFDQPDLISLVVDEEHLNHEKKEKSFAEQVDESLRGDMPFYSSLKVCDTPALLIQAGCEQLPMLYTQKHLRDAVKPADERKHQHGLSVGQIKALPQLLESPVMVLDSVSRKDSIVVVTSEFDKEDNPVVVSIKPNGKGRYEIEEMNANFITSVYSKNNFVKFFERNIEADSILYVSKEKSQTLFERWGLQLPELTNNLDFDEIIHLSRNIVNSKNSIPEENKDIAEGLTKEEADIIRRRYMEELNIEQKKIPIAIESTTDYEDSEAGFTRFATEDMPAGTKYRLVTYGEDGKLVPYQDASMIYNDRAKVQEYIEEHENELEIVSYDDMVYQAGKRNAEYIRKQNQLIEEGLHDFTFDDKGYLHFYIDINDSSYEGLYRIYDPENGQNRVLVSIENGENEPFFEKNWELVRKRLERYVDEHPLMGADGKEISRETACVYCEWSEHDAFEGERVYSISDFDQRMEKADKEWRELRQKEQEQYGDKAFETLIQQGLPQHQSYAKVKYTVYVPEMEPLTLRQDVGDGFGGMIDYIKRTRHNKYYEDLLSEVVLREKELIHEAKGEEGDQTFVLTDAKVSLEMQDILERLGNGEKVDINEINATKELQYCRSIADNGRETYLLDGREDKQKQVLQYMESIGSASGNLDENGKMIYDGDIRRDRRLDIVIGFIGAGKSSALTDVLSQEFHSKVIDNDMAKAQFIEYQDGLGARLVHEEAQMICDKAFTESLMRGENVVLPKVGSNVNKLLQNTIAKAKVVYGYEVNIHFMDLDREKALGRVLSRLVSDGRFLDPELIYKYCPDKEHNYCERSYEALKQNGFVSGYSRWDNDVPKGEKPFMVESHNLVGEFIDNARIKETQKGVIEHEGTGLRNNGDSRQGILKDDGEYGTMGGSFVGGVYESGEEGLSGRGRSFPEGREPVREEKSVETGTDQKENLVKLQGIPGYQKGTPAENLKIGDVLVWNGGVTSEIVGLEPSKTGKTILFQMKGTDDGVIRERRMKTGTLAIIQEKGNAETINHDVSIDSSNSPKTTATDESLVLPEYPAIPEKEDYHNDAEWKQAVEAYKMDNQRFNELIEQLAKEHMQSKSRFSSEEEFIQWLSQNGYTEDAVKGIDLEAASDFATAYEQVLKAIPEIEGNLFSSISLEKPRKKNAVAWVSGDKALHLSDNLFKSGMYGEVIKSQLFHTAQGYYSKVADPFLHVYMHEMGHSVEASVMEKIGGKEKLWSELGNLFNVKVDIGEDLPYISGYGNENYSDWFAEMFSAYVNGSMDENVLKFGQFIQGSLRGELGHVMDKHNLLLSQQYKDFADSHKNSITETKANRIPVIINAFGGPGSGKSVSCMDICQQLKKLGYNAEYVQEYAKELVYDKDWDMLDGSPDNQFEVLKEQLRRVDRLYGKADFIVTDSPVLLNGVYNKSLTPEYDAMVTSLYNDFENFTYFVERDASAYQQEGRIQNLEESQKIDQDIKLLLSEKGIYYGTYNHNTIDKIVSNAIRTFNRVNQTGEEATKKQIAYAEKIAKTLDVDLPEEKTKAAYKAFIIENQEKFSMINAPLREEKPSAGNYQDYLQMVAENGSTLKDVPKEHYTDELFLAAVSNWGNAIRLIPEEKITAEIAMASVQQFGLNLKYIPEDLKNEDICVAAYVSSSGKSMRYTPNVMKDKVKELGQVRLMEDDKRNPNTKRQLEEEKLQEQGQEWITQIDNMLKEHESDPEAMIEDIAFAAKFYKYSAKNIQLMRQQNIGITYVASAAAFEKLGYHIKDNESAMIARVPVFAKYITNEQDERIYSWNYTPEIKQKIKEGTMKEEQAVRKFKFAAAFYDISQTDCPAEDYPSIFHMGVPSEFHQEAFDAMKEFAEKALGFKVMVTDLKSISLRGNCEPDNKIIRINDRLESTMMLSTLCHEIAHGIIHTSENSGKMSTAQKECEADVMDIMLESSLGLLINENRRDHLFQSFHAYKEEQAEQEHPYKVTLEKLIDRVQTKVFRPYAEDMNYYLDLHLPAGGSQNEITAETVVKNIALLDSVYGTDHRENIGTQKELFNPGRIDEYQELYQRTKEEYRLNNSFVPKLAILKTLNGENFYIYDVQLLDEKTAELLKKHPEKITADHLPYNIEEGNILALKESVLADSWIYGVDENGINDVTKSLQDLFKVQETRINCGFDVETEYQCLHNLLENGIELEREYIARYEYLCSAFNFSKNLETDSGMRLMAQINLVTEGLSRNNRELIAEYVFRTGNFVKAEDYAKRIENEPGITRKLLQEMKLVDSYKYMLWTIEQYENSNDISEQDRITTGAYNSSAIPVLSENVNSLSQINNSFLLVRKYASPESVKYYAIVEEDEIFRIAYVELNEYQPETVYSTVSFGSHKEAEEFYEMYLKSSKTRLADGNEAGNLVELENKENQIALSDITSIGKTIASQKQQYKEMGMDEEGALELLRAEIKDTYPDIKRVESAETDNDLQILKDFKKMVAYYGEEHFIELCNLNDFTDKAAVEESFQLSRWLTEQKEILAGMDYTGSEDVKQCVEAALESSVTGTDIEQAFNAIDSAVLSAEFSNLETEFEGFEEYNNVLDTLKAARVTPDKFCYVDFDAAPGPYLYTSDRAGNIYRKPLRDEWDGSVRDLNNRLKEGGYEICSSLDDFKAYSANNRLGIFDPSGKEKNEAYVRILESTNDMLPKDHILSVYDFKNTVDKLYSGSREFSDDITYKLVTRKDKEIDSYIDTYSGNREQNVYEQLYGKIQEQVPELSRVISKQYYQDQVSFNENHQIRPLLEQLKKQDKPIEDSEELNALMGSNDKLKEQIKKLDLSPADVELLKLTAGSIQTEQIANMERQMQMNQQAQQQRAARRRQQEMAI